MVCDVRPRIALAVALVAVLVVGAAGGGYYYWRTISGLFQRTSVNLSAPVGGAMNIVIVGSDSRAGLTDPADVQRFGTVGGRRSDTLILAQIIPSQQRGVIVSIPREEKLLWHCSVGISYRNDMHGTARSGHACLFARI